jgi:hypothetical protein
MTQTAADTKPAQKPPTSPERQPIAIEKLLITHTNPHGVKLPKGLEGKGEEMRHSLAAGVEGDVKTEIDLLPWMQSFRVKRSQRRTHTDKGKEVETWQPMGKPFFVHVTWAVWVPAGEQ